MSVIDKFIAKLAPHDCLGCGTEGHLLCAACFRQLMTITERCYRCRKPSAGFITCDSCSKTSRLRRVCVGAVYKANAKDLVWKLKLAGAQEAAVIMAKRMTVLIKDEHMEAVIVPVPTATGRVRQRGYDQAKLLARELAKQTRLPYLACLARTGQVHQHGTSRRERLAQLKDTFRVTKTGLESGQRVILVDDVVTTGATLQAAAAALETAGLRQIEAVVFAQPQ